MIAHINMEHLNKLISKDLVVGLPRLKFEKDKLCDACQKGDIGSFRIKPWWKMRKLIKERMKNKVINFVGLNKVVLGIKWNNEMKKNVG